MWLIGPFRDVDSRAWFTATWAAPFAIQIVLGAIVGVLVLLGKVPSYLTTGVGRTGGPASFLTVALCIAFTSAALGVWLLRWSSPRVQGLALSLVGSAAVALIGVVVFASWVIRW